MDHLWVIPRFGTEDEHVCRNCGLYADEPDAEFPCQPYGGCMISGDMEWSEPPASVDTHAKRGDAKQAPSDRMGSAVAKRDAQ